MTIKTLTYIHNLLKEDVNTHANAKDYIRQVADKAEAEEAPNAQYLREQYNKAFNKYCEACNALQDFEAKEW